MENLVGFGRGVRTSTAKVGKVDEPSRLVGFESGAKAVTAKVGKIPEFEPATAAK